jgi:hypothetical protein
MELMVPIDIKKLPERINYRDKIMLVGSCFTEHIGNSLTQLKFKTLQNPNGILFGPDSVCKSLLSYIENKPFTDKDLFYKNELWQSWEHHSRFSGPEKNATLEKINAASQDAHDFLREADWLLITLGSAFSYKLTDAAEKASLTTGDAVANCHRAPANWFEKKLIPIPGIVDMLDDCLSRLRSFNPGLKIIITISPVRHIRDGVLDNNRSKARLIEATHQLVSTHDSCYYFPAYELVIDVLRDYRFYDIDLVHPNYAATQFVLDRFTENCIDEESRRIMEDVKTLVTARKHRPFQPSTKAHQQFLNAHFEKTSALQKEYPYLDLKEELGYFSQV